MRGFCEEGDNATLDTPLGAESIETTTSQYAGDAALVQVEIIPLVASHKMGVLSRWEHHGSNYNINELC